MATQKKKKNRKCSITTKTHVKVLLDPGVRGVPVLHSEVTVRVAPGEVLLSHAAGGEVGLWGEVPGDALQDLGVGLHSLFVQDTVLRMLLQIGPGTDHTKYSSVNQVNRRHPFMERKKKKQKTVAYLQ